MPRYDKNIQGGRPIGEFLAPRSRRSSLGQVDDAAKGQRWRATVATGGTITQVTVGGRTYNVHTFTGNGTFTITDVGTEPTIEYLVQAGGGGGTRYSGGGGGGGQVQSGEASAPVFTATVRSHTITIGAGGTTDGFNGFNGNASSIQDVQSCVGGGSSNSDVPPSGYPTGVGSNGGCGGGRRYNYSPPGSGTAGPPRQGYDGGYGGGGTAAAATLSTNNGGAGRSTTIRATTEYFGGGGSSSGYATGVSGSSGGVGGGGNAGSAGGTNTGGGGGPTTGTGVAGGSGIIIIRYPITA